MRTTLNLYKTLVALVGAAAIFWLMTRFLRGCEDLKSLESDYTSLSGQIPSEDSSFFTKKGLLSIKEVSVMRSKVRNPITDILYTNGNELIVYEIDNNGSQIPSDKFILESGRSSLSSGVAYHWMELGNGKLHIKGHFVEPGSKLHFRSSGKEFKSIAVKSGFEAYSLIANNLSIRYSEDGPFDIVYDQVDNLPIATQKVQVLFTKGPRKRFFLYIIKNGGDARTSITDLVDGAVL